MEAIKYLYENTELTMHQIGVQTGTSYKRVFNYVKRNYSTDFRSKRKALCYRNSKLGEKNPMLGVTGDKHHNFVGVVGDSKGYLMVLKPSWYTGRSGSKHVFLHHVVVCLALGLTCIPKGYVVHHCDENPHNNEFSNLVLLTAAGHSKLHQSLGRATTISKESTLKWAEAQGVLYAQ